jgi:uncharacterized membrane protein
MSLLRLGQLIFAVSFTALSIQGMLMHDFNFGRPPEWPDTSARMVWSYVGGLVVICAAIAVITRRYAEQATLIAGIAIVGSIFLLRSIPDLFSKSINDAFWSLNAFKTLALAGGCFIVSVSFQADRESSSAKFLLWLGIIPLAYFLFICGLAHFKFVDFIRGGFMPAHIPFKTFLTYFTGVCLIAGGIGLLIRPVQRLAALMCGIMILGWFFLLHIPRMLVAPNDYLEWFGVLESFGFAGIFWVLAEVFSSANKFQSVQRLVTGEVKGFVER